MAFHVYEVKTSGKAGWVPTSKFLTERSTALLLFDSTIRDSPTDVTVTLNTFVLHNWKDQRGQHTHEREER